MLSLKIGHTLFSHWKFKMYRSQPPNKYWPVPNDRCLYILYLFIKNSSRLLYSSSPLTDLHLLQLDLKTDIFILCVCFVWYVILRKKILKLSLVWTAWTITNKTYSVASLIRIIHLSGHLFGNQSPFLNRKWLSYPDSQSGNGGVRISEVPL